MRLLALVLLLAVLPTVEVTEQIVHLVEHALEADVPDHTAHHDESQGDEHGCTGLVHLCSCHHAQVTFAVPVMTASTIETLESLASETPHELVDLNSLEPPHRPPIG